MSERVGSYPVVWREPDGRLVTGKLVPGEEALRLEGASRGTRVRRTLAYAQLAGVRVGRGRGELINGNATVVLEQREAPELLVGPLGAGLLSEVVDLLNELCARHGDRLEQLAVILPLKDGAVATARRLLAQGPPFDPAAADLERHHVFVSDHEVVFVFEGDDVCATVRRLLSEPSVWAMTSLWSACLGGPPRLAEPSFSWPRPSGTRRP